MLKHQLKRIKQLYNQGENLIAHFKNLSGGTVNDTESILISYDFQAGSYIAYTNKNRGYNNNYTQAVSNVLLELNPDTILEAGVGEATTLTNVLEKMPQVQTGYGFDLSWSRVKHGEQYAKSKGVDKISLCTGDLFSMPFQDNSIDVVYTSHSIEPNGGREKDALKELYRVAKNYVVLLEPCFELAKDKARARMENHGYVTELQSTIALLGYEVVEFRMFDVCANELNPTGLTIIKKNGKVEKIKELMSPYACPTLNSPLKEYDSYLIEESGLLAYPKLMGIPCLLPENAIIASAIDKFT